MQETEKCQPFRNKQYLQLQFTKESITVKAKISTKKDNNSQQARHSQTKNTG